MTPVYHPNIDEQGRVCLDSLTLPPKGMWSPLLTLEALLLSVQQLLAHPNGSDGLSKEVTDVYNSNRAEWERRAREMTAQHSAVGTRAETRDGQKTEPEAQEDTKRARSERGEAEEQKEEVRDTSDGKRKREEEEAASSTEASGTDDAGDKRTRFG